MLDVILMDDKPCNSSAAVKEGQPKEGNLKKQGTKLGLWHTRYFRLHVRAT